jgi:pimeloyl-ACP methyl ester carboxylesterase
MASDSRGLLRPFSVPRLAGQAASEAYSEVALFQPDRAADPLERRYTNDESEFAEIDDVRIHYRDEGDPENQTLLLVHGTYSSLHTWDDWVTALGDEFHIVRLDLPGFGLTGPRSGGEHTLENIIETLGRFCDELGLEDIAVAGNSLGGGIAWRFAIDRPDIVRKLVLLNAGGATLLATLKGSLMRYGTKLVPRYITPRLIIRLIVRDAYGDTSKITPALVRRYHDLLLRTGNRRAVIEIAKNYAQTHYGDDFDAVTEPPLPFLPSAYDTSPVVLDEYQMADIAVPTLFQWGSEDEWLPVSFGRNLADRVSGSTFITYDGVGHVPMEESPSVTASDAAAFLRR